MSPRTSFITQIIFSFWSFEIEDILRNLIFIIGLDSFSSQRFIYLAVWIIIAFGYILPNPSG